MVSAIRVFFVLLLVAGSASAELQLTPESNNYELEGVKLQQLTFPDSGQTAKVTYAPPRGWHYSTRGSQLLLESPKVPAAQAIISTIKLRQSQIFDEDTVKKLVAEVTASVPHDSTNVSIVTLQKNPVLIEKKETLLVVIEYDCYGTSYSRSMLFLNRRDEQIQLQLTSPRGSFAALQKEFMDSQFSWQNL